MSTSDTNGDYREGDTVAPTTAQLLKVLISTIEMLSVRMSMETAYATSVVKHETAMREHGHNSPEAEEAKADLDENQDSYIKVAAVAEEMKANLRDCIGLYHDYTHFVEKIGPHDGD